MYNIVPGIIRALEGLSPPNYAPNTATLCPLNFLTILAPNLYYASIYSYVVMNTVISYPATPSVTCMCAVYRCTIVGVYIYIAH